MLSGKHSGIVVSSLARLTLLRSGITITASYAIRQSSRLLKVKQVYPVQLIRHNNGGECRRLKGVAKMSSVSFKTAWTARSRSVTHFRLISTRDENAIGYTLCPILQTFSAPIKNL